MTLIRTFPSRDALARPAGNRAADVVVFVGAAALLWLIVRVAHGATVPWTVQTAPATVSTDPANLPYYARRSLLRMFIALWSCRSSSPSSTRRRRPGCGGRRRC